jgi:hypothetical protein
MPFHALSQLSYRPVRVFSVGRDSMRTRRFLQRAGRGVLSTFMVSSLTGCFGGPCISASDAIIFTILFVGTVAFVGFALVAFFS